MSTETLRQWFAEADETPAWIFVRGGLREWADVPAEILDREFDAGYGGTQAEPFVAWSANWVYFAATYDGSEWLAQVPRHPTSDFAPEHVGGG